MSIWSKLSDRASQAEKDDKLGKAFWLYCAATFVGAVTIVTYPIWGVVEHLMEKRRGR